MAKKRPSVGQTIGGIIAGFDQQIFRTLPPADELVAKGAPLAPVAASGGGTLTVGLPEELGLAAQALCVEPQTAPPDALNTGPAIVEPGRPLIAEMTWTWRSLAD